MSADWQELKLSDVLELVIDNRGRNPKSYSTSGIPVIDNYLIISKGKADLNNVNRYIDQETYNSFIRKYIQKDDVLMTLVGNGYGKVAITPPEKCIIIQNTIGLRCNNNNSNQYLYYLLSNNRELLINLNRGAAQPSIKVGDILNLSFQFPPLQEQKRIAHILGTLDDQTQLNRQVNQTLEEMGQAIFKSWFVDFDPVKAKIEAKENGQDVERAAMCAISGKTNDELKQLGPAQVAQLTVIAALFPDELVDSELGLIPKGWEWSNIGREVEVVGGGTPSTKVKKYWEDGIYNWTTPRDLSGVRENILLGTVRKITKAGLEKISSGLLPIDTVLLSSRAPVGYLALAKRPVAINQGYIAMKCNARLSPEFVLQWAISIMDDIKQRASGTTFAEINKKNFRDIPVLVPDAKVVIAFQQQAAVVYENIKTLMEESKSLEEIRDTLLPRLLSGEIELSGAVNE